jgi:hypothetical protein
LKVYYAVIGTEGIIAGCPFVDKKLAFSSSGLWKFAREEEGLTIIKQMKES